MTPFVCHVMGADADASPANVEYTIPPRRCLDPTNCNFWPRQPAYWLGMGDHINMPKVTSQSPNYSILYGFHEGAHNDIFINSDPHCHIAVEIPAEQKYNNNSSRIVEPVSWIDLTSPTCLCTAKPQVNGKIRIFYGKPPVSTAHIDRSSGPCNFSKMHRLRPMDNTSPLVRDSTGWTWMINVTSTSLTWRALLFGRVCSTAAIKSTTLPVPSPEWARIRQSCLLKGQFTLNQSPVLTGQFTLNRLLLVQCPLQPLHLQCCLQSHYKEGEEENWLNSLSTCLPTGLPPLLLSTKKVNSQQPNLWHSCGEDDLAHRPVFYSETKKCSGMDGCQQTELCSHAHSDSLFINVEDVSTGFTAGELILHMEISKWHNTLSGITNVIGIKCG